MSAIACGPSEAEVSVNLREICVRAEESSLGPVSAPNGVNATNRSRITDCANVLSCSIVNVECPTPEVTERCVHKRASSGSGSDSVIRVDQDAAADPATAYW